MKPNLDALKLLNQELGEMSTQERILWAWEKSSARLMMTIIFYLRGMLVGRIQKKCQRFKCLRVLDTEGLGFTLIFPKFSIIIFNSSI
tara:strand:- start:3662 stop:3925 length:264 start_codon:yes stop_codon:yes gene_type:complete